MPFRKKQAFMSFGPYNHSPWTLFRLFHSQFGSKGLGIMLQQWCLCVLQWGSVELGSRGELCHFSRLVDKLCWIWENKLFEKPVISITQTRIFTLFVFVFPSCLTTVLIGFYFETDFTGLSVVCVIWVALVCSQKIRRSFSDIHVKAVILQLNLFSPKAWFQVNLTG